MTDLRTAAQQALAFTMRDFASLRDFEAAKAVLHDNLRAALEQQDEPQGCATEEECTYQPWCRIRGTCQRKQADPDISRCPRCGSAADNGHDRELPPNPYFCSRCMAQQAEPVEPVAWAAVTENGKLYKAASTRESAERKAEQQEAKFGDTWRPLHVVPLYTAPPQREPLTEEEIDKIFKHLCNTVGASCKTMARAVERAHGIKE